jgi:hypothetical protein
MDGFDSLEVVSMGAGAFLAMGGLWLFCDTMEQGAKYGIDRVTKLAAFAGLCLAISALLFTFPFLEGLD